MEDIPVFSTADAQDLTKNKFIIFLGDSVLRGMYKDLVYILQRDDLMHDDYLRSKGERSHFQDQLIQGGCLGEMTNKKSYKEVRQFQTPFHLVRFYFITRCYSEYMETIYGDISNDIKDNELEPDVIIMNSSLWDMSRYGPTSMETYKRNLQVTMQRFREELPEETLFLWTTTLPLGDKIRGGFLLPDMKEMAGAIRRDVLLGNNFAAAVVTDYGYDVLDLFYHVTDKKWEKYRNEDDLHWNTQGTRHFTNLILGHIAHAWDVALPRKPGLPGDKTSTCR